MRLIAILACLWPLHAAGEEIRLAHDQAFPPFAELKDGKSQGLAVDVVGAAAARAGLGVRFVAVPFEQIQSTLADGRADAVFPLAINPERRQLFDFSAPLVMTGGALYVRAPNATPESLAALAGKTVATPRTGPLASYLQKNAPDVKLAITSNYEETLAQLMSGQADAAALNFQVGSRLAARLYPGRVTLPHGMFQELPLALAVPKGTRQELVARLDAGLSAIRGDGTWQRINDQWMGR